MYIKISNMYIVNNVIRVLRNFNNKYDIEERNIFIYINDIFEDIEEVFKDIDDDIIIKDYLQKYSLFSFK